MSKNIEVTEEDSGIYVKRKYRAKNKRGFHEMRRALHESVDCEKQLIQMERYAVDAAKQAGAKPFKIREHVWRVEGGSGAACERAREVLFHLGEVFESAKKDEYSKDLILTAVRLGAAFEALKITWAERFVRERREQTAKLKARSKLSDSDRDDIRRAFDQRNSKTSTTEFVFAMVSKYHVSDRLIYTVLAIRKKTTEAK